MDNNLNKDDLMKLNKDELINKCKKLGIEANSTLKKADLVALILDVKEEFTEEEEPSTDIKENGFVYLGNGMYVKK